jgi:beta-glucanase (GH16 family)
MVILVAILVMRKKVFSFITSAGILLVLVILVNSCKKKDNFIITPITLTKPDTPVTYHLYWSDEFNGSVVDTDNWNVDTGNPAVNNEKEYYKAANAIVTGGNLVITAKKEPAGGFPYTSAQINSKGKIDGRYGRIEARIKLPMGVGLWAAFRCMGADNSTVPWPACGEIDIMEHINADNIIYGTMHWDVNGHVQFGNTAITTPDQYHVYAIEWDVHSIRWYVDNNLYVTGNIDNNINHTEVFHLPFFIILNMAVAGDFPGITVNENKLPARMYVDYVRVYQGR